MTFVVGKTGNLFRKAVRGGRLYPAFLAGRFVANRFPPSGIHGAVLERQRLSFCVDAGLRTALLLPSPHAVLRLRTTRALAAQIIKRPAEVPPCGSDHQVIHHTFSCGGIENCRAGKLTPPHEPTINSGPHPSISTASEYTVVRGKRDLKFCRQRCSDVAPHLGGDPSLKIAEQARLNMYRPASPPITDH